LRFVPENHHIIKKDNFTFRVNDPLAEARDL
jgi:hypothetical protein